MRPQANPSTGSPTTTALAERSSGQFGTASHAATRGREPVSRTDATSWWDGTTSILVFDAPPTGLTETLYVVSRRGGRAGKPTDTGSLIEAVYARPSTPPARSTTGSILAAGGFLVRSTKWHEEATFPYGRSVTVRGVPGQIFEAQSASGGDEMCKLAWNVAHGTGFAIYDMQGPRSSCAGDELVGVANDLVELR